MQPPSASSSRAGARRPRAAAAIAREHPATPAAALAKRRSAPVPRAAGTATDRIVEAIRRAVIDRRLPPGARLVEQRLADHFGVSRTIVRQALRTLEGERLVVHEPARGACVAAPGIAESRQVFAARRAVETGLVRALCEQASDADIGSLRRHLDAERGALSTGDAPRGNHVLGDFHVLLARLTGNEVLVRILEDLTARSSLITLLYQSAQSAVHSAEEHVDIVEAIERRDADAAAQLVAAHLAHVEASLDLDTADARVGAALL